MPIYARTAGGVYKPISKILTADGTEISKVVDTNGNTVFENSKILTITGVPPLSFRAIGDPLVSWDLLGNAQQTGTPSPDNIIMPEFCGVRTGNLWINYPNTTTAGVLITSENGVIRFSGVCTTSLNVDVIISLPAGKYKLAANANRNVSSDSNYLINMYKSGVLLFGVQNNKANDIASGELNSDTSDIRMRIRLQKDVDYTGFEMQPMLNAGEAILPWEPYGYKIPFTNASQTVPVYLGQTPTVRRIKKLMLTGEENITQHGVVNDIVGVRVPTPTVVAADSPLICTHARNVTWANFYSSRTYATVAANVGAGNSVVYMSAPNSEHNTLSDIKSYLAAQYAAGTPVTVWYVLATPETGIVNEPLAKIGDYADELHSTDAGVTIPTTQGNNTLTVDTDLPPSSMTIVYKGKS